MNLLYLSSHSILEYDQVRLWSALGYDVFSIGAYSDPLHPGDDKRPALDIRTFPDLNDLCRAQRERHAGQSLDYPVIDWAKYDLHQGLIDWADAIIVDCFPESWIGANWGRIRDKRVIWRTIGQSSIDTELYMRRLTGLQIVRYSPAEAKAFGQAGCFAGEDVLIRFAKYPSDWYGWVGDDPVVGNITQNMVDRADATGYAFWRDATEELAVRPAGPGSEQLRGGLGALDYEAMRGYLRHIRAYLYTGTLPASYTLGLIEAMMTGVPTISIGPKSFGIPELFEGHQIAVWAHDDINQTRIDLERLLYDEDDAYALSVIGVERAINLFGAKAIGRQWLDFLGNPVSVTWQGAEAVGV